MSVLQPGDCHAFEAEGRRFLYLAPSAAVLAVDEVSAAVLDTVAEQRRSPEAVVAALDGRYAKSDVHESIAA